jgi:hypothetical protein
MEYIFDRHAAELVRKLEESASSGEPLDLKLLLKFYAQDVNNELSFSRQYHLQDKGDESILPPMNAYITLIKIFGYWPPLKALSFKYGLYVPCYKRLFRSRGILSREVMAEAAREFEKRRVKGAEKSYEDDDESRMNLLTSLTMARDPETGEQLQVIDIAGEAMSFIAAGSHSTASALDILVRSLAAIPKGSLQSPRRSRPERSSARQ